jgi:hypothetical protein
MEKETYTTIRIWTSTLKMLRLIAAMKGERMVAILDRLVRQEFERVQSEETKR